MKRDGYITVKDGTKIFYTIFGDGEPVLFLHGNGGAVAFSNTRSDPLKRRFSWFSSTAEATERVRTQGIAWISI